MLRVLKELGRKCPFVVSSANWLDFVKSFVTRITSINSTGLVLQPPFYKL